MTTPRKPKRQSPSRNDDTRWLNQMIAENSTAKQARSTVLRERERQARLRARAALEAVIHGAGPLNSDE